MCMYLTKYALTFLRHKEFIQKNPIYQENDVIILNATSWLLKKAKLDKKNIMSFLQTEKEIIQPSGMKSSCTMRSSSIKQLILSVSQSNGSLNCCLFHQYQIHLYRYLSLPLLSIPLTDQFFFTFNPELY